MPEIPKFGSLIRKRREEKRIGLRTMAKRLAVSPTYLSKVERGLELPPKEERIRHLAELLELDFDNLLAIAGRVPSELVDLYRRDPTEVMAILRKSSIARNRGIQPV